MVDDNHQLTVQESKPGCAQRWHDIKLRYNRRLVSGLGAYGRICYHYGAFLMLGGLIFAAVLSAGIPNIEVETDIIELWQQKGSRVQDETDYVLDHYTSYPTYNTFFFRDRSSANNPATKVGLDAMQEIMAEHLEANAIAVKAASASTTGYPARNTTGAPQIKVQSGKAKGLVDHAVCREFAPVAAVLKPCPLCGPTFPSSVAYLKQQNFGSWAYGHLSRCISDNRATMLPGGAFLKAFGLPHSWGVDSFGCEEYSPLQCFKEGGYSYPRNLGMLEDVVIPLASLQAAKVQAGWSWGISDILMGAMNPTSPMAACIDGNMTGKVGKSVKEQFIADMTAIGQGAQAPFLAPQVIGGVKGAIPQFFAFGHRFKTSYKTLTDAEITMHLSAAKKNDAMPVQKCLTTPSPTGKGMFPCCRTSVAVNSGSRIFGGFPILNSDGSVKQFTDLRALFNRENQVEPKIQAVLKPFGLGDTKADRDSVLDQLDAETKKSHQSKFHREGQYAHGKKYGNVRVDFDTSTSLKDNADEFARLPAFQICMAMVLLLVFSVVYFSPLTCASSNLGSLGRNLIITLTGFVAICCAVIAGFGVVGFSGAKVSPVNVIIPIISLGIGMDDLFILMHMYTCVFTEERLYGVHHFYDIYGLVDPTPGRLDSAALSHMQLTLAGAGSSMSLTTIGNFLAFMFASLIPIGAASSFCQQMALTVLFLYVFLMLMVAPVMCWTCQGARGLPVCILGALSGDFGKITVTPDESSDNSLSVVPQGDDKTDTAGTLAPSLNEIVAQFMSKHYWRALSKTPVKIGVCLCSLGLFGLGLWGSTQIQLGFDVWTVLPDNTYQKSYYKMAMQKTRTNGNHRLYIVSRGDIAPVQTQTAMLELVDKLSKSKWTVKNSIRSVSFLANSSLSLLHHASATAKVTANALTPIPEKQFYTQWNGWMGSWGALFTPLLVCQDSVTSVPQVCSNTSKNSNLRVVSTQQFIDIKGARTNREVVDAVKDLREIADSVVVNGSPLAFIWGEATIFYEQYITIEHMTYLLCGLSLTGVVVATFILQLCLKSALLIAIIIFFIVVEAYGSIELLGLRLNAFAVANLCVAVGMAVEFTAHYARAFAVASGDMDTRMQTALRDVGSPLFAGAITTLLSVTALGFSKFDFLIDYYFRMFSTITLIAFVNSAVFLPVWLCLLGPRNPDVPGEAEAQAQDSSGPDPISGQSRGRSSIMSNLTTKSQEGTMKAQQPQKPSPTITAESPKHNGKVENC